MVTVFIKSANKYFFCLGIVQNMDWTVGHWTLDTGQLDTGQLDTGQLDTGQLDSRLFKLNLAGCIEDSVKECRILIKMKKSAFTV